MRVRFFSMLACLSLCGCAAMQDYHYNWVQTYRADTAWRQSYGLWNSQFTADYKDGWKIGYAELSKGGCDEPPPVPPRKYWSAAYQSDNGKCCIDEWYTGWRDGAAAAKACGNAQWHEIMTAPTVPKMNPPAQNTGPGTYVNPLATQEPRGPELREMPRPQANLNRSPLMPVSVPELDSDTENAELRAAVASGTEEVNGSSNAVGDNYAVPLPGVHPSPVITSGDSESEPAVTAPAEVSTEAPYGSAVEVFVDGAKN